MIIYLDSSVHILQTVSINSRLRKIFVVIRRRYFGERHMKINVVLSYENLPSFILLNIKDTYKLSFIPIELGAHFNYDHLLREPISSHRWLPFCLVSHYVLGETVFPNISNWQLLMFVVSNRETKKRGEGCKNKSSVPFVALYIIFHDSLIQC